jgi:hypothetical protein
VSEKKKLALGGHSAALNFQALRHHYQPSQQNFPIDFFFFSNSAFDENPSTQSVVVQPFTTPIYTK